MAQMAQEYTPELSSEVLSSYLNNIDESESANVGKARSESRAGGLGAQASTGAEIAGVETGAQKNRDSAIAGFNLDVAGKQYGERMTDEKQAFADTARQKNEDFQKSMTEMGYQFADSQRNNQNRANKIQGEQGMLESAGLSLGTKALSGLIGAGMGGAAAGGGGGAGNFNDSFSADSVGEGANDLNGDSWGF